MEMTVRMPANYNLLAEEEMTYTTGGATAEALCPFYGWFACTAIRDYRLVGNWLGFCEPYGAGMTLVVCYLAGSECTDYFLLMPRKDINERRFYQPWLYLDNIGLDFMFDL